jgi:hypothetical protein
MTSKWQVILATPQQRMSGGEWIGIYQGRDVVTPAVVIQTKEAFIPKLGAGTWWVPMSVPTFSVSLQLPTLATIPKESRLQGARWDTRGEDLESPVTGYMKRVRVALIKRGPKKTCMSLFYGHSDRLIWDPKRFQWNQTTLFMSYTAEIGRDILKQRHIVPDVVATKWQGVLPKNYNLRWANAWDDKRVRKEAGLIWMTWHRAVAVNERRGQINVAIPQACRVCNNGTLESVLHRF